MATLIAASGCSSAPQSAKIRDDMQYDRVDRALSAAEQFSMFTRACRNQKGVVQVRRAASRVPLQPSDMASAVCVRLSR